MRATGILLNVRSILAFIPGGGSNTKMRPARSRFTGTWGRYGQHQTRIPHDTTAHSEHRKWCVTLGLISMVRKSRKLACGCMEWSFFSSCISQPGARWTFSSITHLTHKHTSGHVTSRPDQSGVWRVSWSPLTCRTSPLCWCLCRLYWSLQQNLKMDHMCVTSLNQRDTPALSSRFSLSGAFY